MSEEVLTVESAVTKHRIMSLPRRIADLKKQGVDVSDLWDKSVSPPVKRWFFSKEDRITNSTKFSHIHIL